MSRWYEHAWTKNLNEEAKPKFHGFLYLCKKVSWCNNNNNLIHLYSALHRRGESPHPPPMCSIHLDDATAAILHQNAHHTPAYWWRGDRVMKPISVWGWLGGHDGQRPMGKFGQDAGLHPYSFSKDILGFLMTTESQDLGLTSHPKDVLFTV